ncbi:MAG: glycosyltransferase family 2 protein [Methanobacteriaceae archaeon]|nr:glycosyltransferase family 2 protein [Methanobacteriaceae archaeon]MDP2835956.1 glycosyltransferase family 2 protein [Methanobacteriaceae archaeon]MDP3035822.1 glycosyltransferase family 2 protein [Methanobacteriaceae archaeon]MDP3484553.1 glycosyltransferase family 2 protein [Methanobacteriaceae archaeon]MDP3622967.1 glycosyltransferase family 2 protein [Methanobacteriaceae archaeon]
MVNLTVIIPNYNGKHFLKECFESLMNQDYSFEVIIVDNASEDGSIAYIEKNYPEFVLIQNKKNLGFAAAVNQGINRSQTEYVFLLNNDVELEADCIPSIVNCLEKDDKTFAVTSKMVQYHNRNKIDDAGDEYTVLGWTKRVGYNKSSNDYNIQRETFSACAGAAIYRKSVFDKIGLFDENFFAYLEDVDISFRGRIHGYKCIYCPEAVVYHRGSGTSGSQYNKFKIRLAARNNVYVPYKNMPWPQLILNSPFLLLGYFIKYLFFMKKGQRKTYLKGLKEGLLSLNKVKKVKYLNKNLVNYFKIEGLLIKNTLKFLFF